MYKFSHLFSQSLKEKNFEKSFSISAVLLDEGERKAVEAIKEFKNTHGDYPSMELANLIEECQIYVGNVPNESLDVTFSLVLDSLKNRQVLRAINQAQEEFDTSGEFPISKHITLLREIDIAAAKVSQRQTIKNLNPYLTSSFKVPYPWPVLNTMTGGLFDGELTSIVGRPGEGKTTAALQLVAKWFLDGMRIGVISFEMSNLQLQQKLHAILGGFDSLDFKKLANNELKMQDMTKNKATADFTIETGEKRGGDIVYFESNSLEGLLKDLRKEKPFDIFVVDSVYLARVDEKSRSSGDWKELKTILNSLKTLALGKQDGIAYQMPVIVTSQLKRGAEIETAEMDSVAFSDAFGQDSDLLMMIEGDKTGRQKYIKVLKNRSGPNLGLVEFEIDHKTSKMVVK